MWPIVTDGVAWSVGLDGLLRWRPKSLITWKKSTQITKPKSQTLCDKMTNILYNLKQQKSPTDASIYYTRVTTHQFADYFCSTYIETTIFPCSLWAQVPSYVHRTKTPFTWCKLSNRFDNRLDVCLHDAAGCPTGCTVVSCKRSIIMDLVFQCALHLAAPPPQKK